MENFVFQTYPKTSSYLEQVQNGVETCWIDFQPTNEHTSACQPKVSAWNSGRLKCDHRMGRNSNNKRLVAQDKYHPFSEATRACDPKARNQRPNK